MMAFGAAAMVVSIAAVGWWLVRGVALEKKIRRQNTV
jgi:hypothetical protein